jgi:hypothetical protein
MSNATTTATVKASAEGYTLRTLSAALRAVEAAAFSAAVKAAEAALRAPFQAYPVQDTTVLDALTGDRYYGGYMYTGTSTVPNTFQGQRWASSPSVDGDATGAAAWMAAAPVGTEVHTSYNLGSAQEWSLFRKTDRGWMCVDGSRDVYIPDDYDRPFLPFGVRKKVADRLGVGLSAHFHELFDQAVEQLD